MDAGKVLKSDDLIAKVKIIPDLVTLNVAESRLNVAKIKVADAKKHCDRRRKLFKKGIIAETEFQKYEVALESANEELAAARNNLQLVKNGIAKSMGADHQYADSLHH